LRTKLADFFVLQQIMFFNSHNFQPSLPPSLGTSNGSLKRRMDVMKASTHTAIAIGDEYGGNGMKKIFF